jgi:hypothetical protein
MVVLIKLQPAELPPWITGVLERVNTFEPWKPAKDTYILYVRTQPHTHTHAIYKHTQIPPPPPPPQPPRLAPILSTKKVFVSTLPLTSLSTEREPVVYTHRDKQN